MKRKRENKSLGNQIKSHSKKREYKSKELDGNFNLITHTGSTLLDLAISGGRIRGGGLPAGILVEAFGPSSSGKTALLCEIAGAVQRNDGEILFQDPEARLDKVFAKTFDFDPRTITYSTPDTVPQMFEKIRTWNPKDTKIVNGSFNDSLAALSTDMEMDKEDKMGGRRAKEFSQELRKTCRMIKNNNYLVICSNQIREDIGITFGSKVKAPGGKGIGFYSSLRLRTYEPQKIWRKRRWKGKDIKKAVGVRIQFEVFKSSIWNPYGTAPVSIIFGYGIDDVRENLQFVKDYTDNKVYTLNGENLDKSMDQSISIIESENAEEDLRNEVIDLWEAIEEKFIDQRKKKKR